MTDTVDHVEDRPKKPNGSTQFPPGHVPKVRRAPGTRNKITRDIKHGLIESAVKHGSDGKGKGGLIGYFDYLLKKDLRAHAALMGKLLPYNVSADLSVSGISALRIVSVPHDRYLSPDQVRRLTHPDLEPPSDPVVIESTPVVIEPEPEPVEPEPTNVTRLNPWDPK